MFMLMSQGEAETNSTWALSLLCRNIRHAMLQVKSMHS